MTNSAKDLLLKFRAFFFSAAVIVLLSSCLDDDDNYINEPLDVAYVSIYHAVPDGPGIDIVVDGRVINNTPFEYTDHSGYLNFFTGNRNIRFNVADASNALVDTTFNLENGRAYSLFAVDTLPNVKALLVVDSAGTPGSGKAMVRFVNLSPDAEAFNVATDGGTSLFAPRSFKEASEYVEIDADVYTFDLLTADSGDVVVSGTDVEILPGRYYTVIARGFVNPPAGNNNVLSIEVIN